LYVSYCHCLQFLGWRGAALMTPLVCLAAGAVFFAGSLFPPGSLPVSSPMAALLALGPIAGIMVQVRAPARLMCTVCYLVWNADMMCRAVQMPSAASYGFVLTICVLCHAAASHSAKYQP
jgi:hypothetical protein